MVGMIKVQGVGTWMRALVVGMIFFVELTSTPLVLVPPPFARETEVGADYVQGFLLNPFLL